MNEIIQVKPMLVSVGNNIRQIRLQRGLKQKQLAVLCNMEKASVSRIEAGKTNMTLLTLLNMATVLETAVADLFIP